MKELLLISILCFCLDLIFGFDTDFKTCWIGALIGAAAATTAAVGNAIHNSRQNNRQWETARSENDKARLFNQEMAERQNRWNLEQWHRENAYNDPSQQMKRFAKAGINPNLAISGPQSLAGSSPSAAQVAPAQPTDTSMLGAVANPSPWNALAVNAAQVSNIMADTKLKNAEAAKATGESEGINIDNVYKALHHEQELKIGETTISLNSSGVKLNEKQVEKLTEDINVLVESRAKIQNYVKLIQSQLLTLDQDRREQLLNNAVDRAFKEAQSRQLDAATNKLINDLKLQKEQFNYLVKISAQQALGLEYNAELSRLNAAEKKAYESYFQLLADTNSHITLDRNFIEKSRLELWSHSPFALKSGLFLEEVRKYLPFVKQ